MARTFGGTTADVVANLNTALPIEGDELTVWTAPEGSLITGNLEDLDGTPITVVTTDANGTFAFRINVDTWSIVHVRDSNGNWYRCLAEEIEPLAAQAAEEFPAMQAAVAEAVTAVDAVAKSLASYATPGQLDGTDDCSSAFQAAISDLQSGGRLTVPPGSQLRFNGSAYVDISGIKGLTIDLAGSRLFKDTAGGYATMFLDRFNGTTYGAGVQRLVIENGHFQGSFAEGATAAVQPLGSNHGQGIIVRNCTFTACMVQGFHTFELDGVDGIRFEACRWYGYKPDGVNPARTEAINIDVSQVGAGATVAPYGSGLPCRNIYVDAEFLPWTDPATSITWPAPIPLGTHGSREGAITENVYLNIYVEDPPVDTIDILSPATDDPYHRGLVHIPSVRHVRGRIRVKATDGQGSIRAVQLQAASIGVLASSDPNSAATSGNFTTPNPCEDIDLDVRVEGLNNSAASTNPAVFVGGVAALPAKDIKLRVSADGVYRDACMVYRGRNVHMDVQGSNIFFGARAFNSEVVKVTGQMTETVRPVQLDDVTDFVVDGVVAKTVAPQTALVTYVDATDDGVIIGCRGNGYTSLTTVTGGGVAPVNVTESGNNIA